METKITTPIRPGPDFGRRTFLKTGIAGSALLFAGRWLSPAQAADAPNAAFPFKYLKPADVGPLARIIPVMLAGSLPKDPAQLKTVIGEVLYGIDLTLAAQTPTGRKQIGDLFGLLNSSVTRSLVAGIWKPWDQASDEDIHEFLTKWRNSRFDLLQSAYLGLHDIIFGSWYGNPRSWAHAGYSGPPKIA